MTDFFTPHSEPSPHRLKWTAPKLTRLDVDAAQHGPGPYPDSDPIDS